MVKMATGFPKQAKRKWSVSVGSMLLSGSVLVSIAMLTLSIIADANHRQGADAARACSSLKENAERLACYDKLGHGEPSHPFKGANAPPIFGAN